MGYYFFLVGCPLVYYIYCNLIKKGSDLADKKNRTIDLFFLIFLSMLCLRDVTCGSDLVNYETFWEMSKNTSFDHVMNRFNLEIGYHLMEYVLVQITDEFQILIIVVALLSVIPVWILYRNESESPLLTIALFLTIAFFPLYFSGLRQILAIALIVPAYYCAKQRRLVKFIFIILIASIFHISALVALVIYPLYHAKITKNCLYIIVPSMLAVIASNKYIFGFLLLFLDEKYAERYSKTEETGAYSILILLALFVFYAFIIPKNDTLDKETIGLRNILLAAVFIQCFAPIHTVAMRMNYYFLLFIPILIPKIIKRSNKRMLNVAKLSAIVFVVFFFFYFFWNAYTSADILQIYPYVPVWKK